jgi:hypothetical protein
MVLALGADNRVTLVENSVPRMTILAGSVPQPVEELRRYVEQISGGRLPVEPAQAGKSGILVGLAADFPWRRFEEAENLGREGFLIQSEGSDLLLIGHDAAGVQHAVSTFLSLLGCRWFFPGPTWAVIPKQATIAGSWRQREEPSFALQRKMWYGFGATSDCARDFAEWERHNRTGGVVPISIGHTWHGLDPQADFQRHPDWFALVAGRRQASKPCYSHPEVIRRASEYALKQAAGGAAMISMTPPDGLGYCECERCMSVCRGGEPYQENGTTFARRPDGALINVVSENLFAMVNNVAAAVAEKHPQVLVGCYAYSAYSHPPSFNVHPNVFLQTTTAFRRTPLSLTEQLQAFKKIGVQSGIRGYFSVYQWDWDYPTVAKGDLALPQLVDDLRFYRQQGVQSINSEMCNNWAARGLGYYLAARLLWNVEEDPQKLIADFYDKAFGPAALPMERYYVRWLGPYVAVRTRSPGSTPASAATRRNEAPQDGLGSTGQAAKEFNLDSLKAAYRDLDEAARLANQEPQSKARIDHLRMYAHYLYLRTRLEAAAKTSDQRAVRAAVADETVFGSRLTNVNLIHTRPLLGKEFYRRFLPYKDFLAGTPEWPVSDRDAVTAAGGKGFRQVRADVPGAEELEHLWAADKAALEIQ